MMCQRIGRPPISIIGFGLISVSSDKRVPNPPARITIFIEYVLQLELSQPNRAETLRECSTAVRDELFPALGRRNRHAPNLRPSYQSPGKRRRLARKDA